MYVYADDWFSGNMCPQEDESYASFISRVVPAMKALKPEESEERIRDMAESAWASHMLQNASEATVKIQREFIMNPYYNEGYWTSWKITEMLSAVTAKITYSSVEKARERTGDKSRIAKTIEEKQQVFGWANVAKDADGNFPIDWEGDVTTPEELEKAAYTFVLKYRAMGEAHAGEAVAELIESVMFTKEKQEALGIPEGILPEAWWVGFHIPDKEVFAKVKSGEYEMLSVQGKALREPTGQ